MRQRKILVAAVAALVVVAADARADVPISCDGTPFGAQVTLGLDAEMVVATPTNSLNLWRLYDPALAEQAFGAISGDPIEIGSTFLESARVDFDGDGRDEVVGLYRGTNGDVVVGVFQPEPGGPFGDVLFPKDAWRQASAFAEAHFVVGDFDGSQDGREEIAVAWRPNATLSIEVRILDGDAAGLIAQANGASIAAWTRTTGVQARPFALATGDLLLDGRDQLVVANLADRAPNGFVIDYHLLEYQTPWPSLLPIGTNTNIGTLTTTDIVGSAFETPGGSPAIASIPKFVVNAGDVVDGAASELVLHLQGVFNGNNFIGQRLFNWRTTRNLANDITAIQFVRQDSRLAQTSANTGTPTWDAAIGNIDLVPPSEIVVVRGDVVAGNNDRFTADAWKVDASGPAPRTYQFRSTPTNSAFVAVPTATNLARGAIAIGDMQSDGFSDVLAAAQEGSSVRRVRFAFSNPTPGVFAGTQVSENISPNVLANLDVIAADFDNDSVLANISSASCREVDEPSVRNVVWMPPHFDTLNPNGHAASFGRTTVSGGSATTSFGAFTATDVSAYIGASVGGSVLGIGAEASARVTGGYSYQASFGEFFGTSNEETLTEAFVQQTNGAEALVVNEIGKFRCYEYDILRDGVAATDSSVRFCAYDEIASAGFTGTDAASWESPTLVNGRTPAQWFQLQRDWANVALFRAATTNMTTAAGAGIANLTDGQFTTAVRPANPSQPAAPYVEVDLGTVQPIIGARVVSGTTNAGSLRNTRLYLSAQPFAGPGVPSGAGITSYAPETTDGSAYDRWNLRIRGPGDAPVAARFVRLQRSTITDGPNVAELQLFTDVHQEPDRYPQSVCDPTPNDNRHRVEVWNPVAGAFAPIDERGDLIWSGSPDTICTNHAGVREVSIWGSTSIGGSSNVEWSLAGLATTVNGVTRSIESSVRVGAEFDISGGFIASVQAGGAYEFTSGVTEDVQSEVFWGTGTEMGGSAAGFNAGPAIESLCRYRAQPHGYRLYDRSNTGYEHGFYVVDYIVDQAGSAWTRANVPIDCRGPRPDALFSSGFE